MLRAGVLRTYRHGVPTLHKQQRVQVAAITGVFHSVPSIHPAPIPCRTLNTGPYTSNGEQIRWRFPVDDRTEGMISQIHHFTSSLTSVSTFNAVKPITHQLMEEAMNILYDKIESLRVCIRLRENQLWVAEMPERLLDLKLVTGSDQQKEHNDLGFSPFDLHNGPLWKARLLTCSEDTPCQFPEVKAKFPYQYDVLLSLHHATNDGPVLMLILEMLHRIIDQLLQGLPVDRQQVGELRDGIEVREEENRIRTALQNDPARLEAALQEFEMTKHVPLLIEAFGSPSQETNRITNMLPLLILDEGQMKKVSHKCRSLGITIHACMSAMSNTVLVEMAREAGVKRNNYSISSYTPVNTRRLMPRSSTPYLGFHGIPLIVNMATPHNVKNNFWQYAKSFDTEFRNKIQRNAMCEQRVLIDMMKPEGYTHDQHYANPLPLTHDYLFTNLYSPDNYIKGTGKFVQITYIKNCTFIHRTPYPFVFSLLGLRGQAQVEMVHSTVAHTEEVIRRWSDKLVAILHDVASALG